MISRPEFEDVAIHMLHFAACNFFESFLALYGTGMLWGTVLTQAAAQVILVNNALTVQSILSYVPTLGGLIMPSFLRESVSIYISDSILHKHVSQ